MSEGLAFPAHIRTLERSAATAGRSSSSSPSNSSYYQESAVATPRSRFSLSPRISPEFGDPGHGGQGIQASHGGYGGRRPNPASKGRWAVPGRSGSHGDAMSRPIADHGALVREPGPLPRSFSIPFEIDDAGVQIGRAHV